MYALPIERMVSIGIGAGRAGVPIYGNVVVNGAARALFFTKMP